MNPGHLLGNDFFSGGLALAALAALAAFMRRYVVLAVDSVRRRYVSEIEVRDGDMVMWFGLWLANTPYGRGCRRLSIYVHHRTDEEVPVLYFEPGIGPHVFRHQGTLLVVDRRREEGGPGNRIPQEWFVLRVFGARLAAEQILDQAKAYSRNLLSRQHSAYISDGRGGWDRLGVGVPRELASVVLPGSMVEDVVSRIKGFLARRSWYADRGIPWRLGFGLFGPPRTGKTSLVRAISHELGLPLYVLDMTSKEFSDKDLVMTLSRLPVGAVLLVEDIDEQFGAKSSSVTLSGLLNALDGSLATEGRILFVTSNAPERLDAALVGEGRLDVHVTFGYATRDQSRGMWLRFFPELESLADQFAAAVPEGKIPPAAIQEHLVTRADDPDRALAEAPLLGRREVRIVARGETSC